MNNDGKQDAAIFIYRNFGGGTGSYANLVVFLNNNGVPNYFNQIEVGDRVKINSIKINDGVINVNMTTHGPDDPMCCPSVTVDKKYKLNLGINEITDLSGKFLKSVVAKECWKDEPLPPNAGEFEKDFNCFQMKKSSFRGYYLGEDVAKLEEVVMYTS
ncbi:MAG TPA: hypothetical protein PJ997_02750 [Candidatus Paceibacterota bacterium]|nr:hypothetical protein [Candidatus Paceibacterota bacterium]HMP19231.1 hypothetical protein [Candidatus Paceibacterota bacterium]HMP85509.1 hypothetical protein [Candidatus Paceibacterota bacterium]